MSEREPTTEQAVVDIETVPTVSGCYLMRDAKGQVIYVGKAKSLRSRIRSYLNAQDTRYSVQFLMQRVANIEFLVTTNEKEALLLEDSLIKQYKPRYNVRLRDDKTYVSLRIDMRDDFPRLTIVRRPKRDGARYFGPYSSAQSVRETVRQIHRIFPLRTCSDSVMKSRVRPCLYCQMGRCFGPCTKADRTAYHEIAEQVVLVLENRNDEVERLLAKQIEECSAKMAFEKAAELRDRLFALRRTLEKQRAVAAPGAPDRDVFGYYVQGRYVEIQILFFRGGRMLGGRSYSFPQCEMPLDELFSSFLLQYYAQAPVFPNEALMPLALEDAESLEEVLSERSGARVTIQSPQRGEKRALIDLAMRNAKSSFDEKQLAEKAHEDVINQVRAKLGLTVPPRRIECFDISTTQGAKPVGAMVVFENGLPAKSRFRKFAIRDVEGQDDYAMLREVLLRRYTRAVEEDDLPDLVLIDGGKGQLNVAVVVMKDLGIEDLDVASIAKPRDVPDGGKSPERFFVPGRLNPIILPQTSEVVHFLAQVRDETHRFAVTYHRQRRSAATLRTMLTDIPGVGPKRAQALLKALGSLAKIRAATIEEIAAVPGVDARTAANIKRHLSADANTGVGGTNE